VSWGKRLDGVVNDAAIADPAAGPIESLSLVRWRKFLDVNLTGTFLVTKYAVPHVKKTKGGIINIASTRAVMSEPDTEPYAACKGALVAFTHALAISLGPRVRVNCVSPGWIATQELAPRDQRKQPRLSKQDHAQHPVGRVGRPQDVAETVAFLLDGSRSGFVTCANFVVDGGMTRTMITRNRHL